MESDKMLFKKIFVVLDQHQEDQPALDRARLLAKKAGSSLHLFICAYDRAVGIASFFTRSEKSHFISTIMDGNQVKIDRLEKDLREEGIELSSEVVWNRRPAEAIIESINNSQCDLLIKKTGHGPEAKAGIFSHIDRHILRYSPSPVLLVKSHQWHRAGKLVAAVNSAPEDSAHRKLNERILRTSRELADALNFSMHLVSAYPAPPAHFPPGIEGENSTNYRQKMSQMVIKNVGAFATQHQVDQANVHCIEGPADWAIPKVSRKISADFVVIGTVARQRMNGLALGNTAEHILDELDCDVLVLKSKRSSR